MKIEAGLGQDLPLIYIRPPRNQLDRPAIGWSLTNVIEALLEAGQLVGLSHGGILPDIAPAGRNDCAVTVAQARKLALSFPETIEQPHWGNPSFRVRGRIFATVPDTNHLNVMIDPFDVDAVVRAEPESCAEILWGKEVRGVRVSLPNASPAMVEDLLRAAWQRKAPKRLLN